MNNEFKLELELYRQRLKLYETQIALLQYQYKELSEVVLKMEKEIDATNSLELSK
jgi:hypothetical protein